MNQQILHQIIKDDPVIDYRPADDIPPQFEKLKEQYKDLVQSDEDVLSCALFENVAVKFLENRNAPTLQDEVEEFDVLIG